MELTNSLERAYDADEEPESGIDNTNDPVDQLPVLEGNTEAPASNPGDGDTELSTSTSTPTPDTDTPDSASTSNSPLPCTPNVSTTDKSSSPVDALPAAANENSVDTIDNSARPHPIPAIDGYASVNNSTVTNVPSSVPSSVPQMVPLRPVLDLDSLDFNVVSGWLVAPTKFLLQHFRGDSEDPILQGLLKLEMSERLVRFSHYYYNDALAQIRV